MNDITISNGDFSVNHTKLDTLETSLTSLEAKIDTLDTVQDNALTKLGLEKGDTIGTLAWNTFRHFELYFGVSGTSPNIANFAHLGGMLFGFLLLRYWGVTRS